MNSLRTSARRSDSRLKRTLLAVAATAAALALSAGCTSQHVEEPTARPTTQPHASTSASATARATARFPAYSATARVAAVQVHASADGPVTVELANPQESGAPLTFLVDGPVGQTPTGAWVQVLLPIRPNGSKGWVRASDVEIAGLRYRIDVAIGGHRLDLFENETLLKSFPIGVGRTNTPTPGGTFYLKELLQPPNPSGPYGPYAYGLSGFSTTLKEFNGGDAVIGIHGTDDPSSIGSDVSHGCIRMKNADITELAHLLPLGTPVRILA